MGNSFIKYCLIAVVPVASLACRNGLNASLKERSKCASSGESCGSGAEVEVTSKESFLTVTLDNPNVVNIIKFTGGTLANTEIRLPAGSYQGTLNLSISDRDDSVTDSAAKLGLADDKRYLSVLSGKALLKQMEITIPDVFFLKVAGPAEGLGVRFKKQGRTESEWLSSADVSRKEKTMSFKTQEFGVFNVDQTIDLANEGPKIDLLLVSSNPGSDNYRELIKHGDYIYYAANRVGANDHILYRYSPGSNQPAVPFDQNGDISLADYGSGISSVKVDKLGQYLVSVVQSAGSPAKGRFSKIDSATGLQELTCHNGASANFDMLLGEWTMFNSELYFVGTLPATVYKDLHKCNLATGVASRVVDIRVGAADNPSSLVAGSNYLYFSSYSSGGNYTKLHRLSASGVLTQVSNTRGSATLSDNPSVHAVAGDDVLFSAEVSSAVRKFYIYSPNTGVTSLGDVKSAGATEEFIWAAKLKSALFFIATDNDGKQILYRVYSPTPGAARIKAPVFAANTYVQPTLPEVVGDKLYVRVQNSAGFWRLVAIGEDGAVQEVDPLARSGEFFNSIKVSTRFKKIDDKYFYQCSKSAVSTTLCFVKEDGSSGEEPLDLTKLSDYDLDPVPLARLNGKYLLISALNRDQVRTIAVVKSKSVYFKSLGRDVYVTPYLPTWSDGAFAIVPLRLNDLTKSELSYYSISVKE